MPTSEKGTATSNNAENLTKACLANLGQFCTSKPALKMQNSIQDAKVVQM